MHRKEIMSNSEIDTFINYVVINYNGSMTKSKQQQKKKRKVKDVLMIEQKKIH